MGKVKKGKEQVMERLKPASEGSGPFLQRDYWGVIENCRLSAPEVASLVRERFFTFPPESLVVFERSDGGDGVLDVGDELVVKIRMAGKAAVCVVHVNENSITLGTERGHPEAGRITFGAYPNERGDVIFHIRSRARSGSSPHYAGFITAGEPMQTNTWTDFIDRLAHMVGDGVIGAIQVETREIDAEDEAEAIDTPTFVAKGA